MTKRIFQSICVAAISVLLCSLFLIVGMMYGYFSKVQREQLKVQTEMAAHAVAHEGALYFANLDTGEYRVTWIDQEGNVLCDTESEASEMENHLDREEVKAALEYGYGESTHDSRTLTKRFFYAAQKLPDGTVIRLAGTQYTAWMLLLGALRQMLLIAAAAVALSLFLASRLSKHIIQPLNELNLEETQENKGYPELQPLFVRIRSQQEQLKKQEKELRRKKEEFDAVTANMNEGIVLLNERGVILSVNHTASRILSVGESCVGEEIRTLHVPQALRGLLKQTEGGRTAKEVMEIGEARYQMNASPVRLGSHAAGTAILIFDITEKEKAEKMRREFTANVSHELKTPLHSISGYAELLKNGMVKPADVEPFCGRIYAEAQRMIALIEDIISLSHLDEGAEDMAFENTDLYEIAEEAVQSLRAKAEAAQVSLSLQGERTVISGIPRLLHSIVFNLCDNAVKYNKENGLVNVEIRNEETRAVLTVEDTGIGIPREDTERVFERFYRVDKSHSKEVGGTGLGLSIVKHAVRLHHAGIVFQSDTGKGTKVTVSFWKQRSVQDGMQ